MQGRQRKKAAHLTLQRNWRKDPVYDLACRAHHNIRVFIVPSITPLCGSFHSSQATDSTHLFCSSINAGKPNWVSEVVVTQKPTLHIFTYYIINSFQVLLKLLTDSNYLQESLIWTYFPVVEFCGCFFFSPPLKKLKASKCQDQKSQSRTSGWQW